MNRVLVIGGKGFYGARTAAALRALADVSVTTASRRARGGDHLRVDLGDPSTWEDLDRFSLVVNCADAVNAPATEMAAFCLARGVTLVDMGADFEAVRALLGLSARGARGRVMAGAGVFPGLSTAMAHHLATAHPSCSRLDFAVRLSPFSGAGSANCALMAKSLTVPSFYVADGEWRQGPPMGAASKLAFAGLGSRVVNRVGFPDVALIERATGAAGVEAHLALIPAVMRHGFRVSVAVADALPPLRTPILAATRWSMLLLRGLLLRGFKTPLHMTVVANRGADDERQISIRINDGQMATALGVAAAVRLWLDGRLPPEPGVYPAGAHLPLDDLIAAMRTLGGSGFRLDRQGD